MALTDKARRGAKDAADTADEQREEATDNRLVGTRARAPRR